MRIKHITSTTQLAILREGWNSLLQRSASKAIFLTWEWVSSWWAAYQNDKSLLILLAHDERGECVGIAPLYTESLRHLGRILRFIGDGTFDSDYLDFIVAAGQETAVLPAFFAELARIRSQWDVMQLNEIPDSSPNLSFLRTQKERAGWIFQEEHVSCGIADFPRTWDEYLQTLRPRFRTSIRACLRNLEEWNGGFEHLADQESISCWLEELFTLHSGRWALRHQTGVFANAAKRAFYGQMAHYFLEQGWLHVTRWRVNGHVLAIQFGFVYDRTYHLLQEGFDAQCIHVSPGITLRAATIRDLMNRGVNRYDFLGGLGRHKTDWSATEKRSVRLTLAPPGRIAYAYIKIPDLIEKAKARIKPVIPSRLLAYQQRKKNSAALNDTDVGDTTPLTSRSGRSWKHQMSSMVWKLNALPIMQYASQTFEVRRSGPAAPLRIKKVSCPKFVILCYHRIGSGGVPLYSEMPPQIFEAQMRYLRRQYRIVSLNTIYEELQRPLSNKQSVAVTFDDGYQDLYANAFPILQKYQIPATIYLTADAINTGKIAWYDKIFLCLSLVNSDKMDILLDRPRRFLLPTQEARLQAAETIISYLRTLPDVERRKFCDNLDARIPVPADQTVGRMLTWDHIRRMQDSGISFGSHTLTHPVLSRLDSAQLGRELSVSKERLERHLETPVVDFAYPFGKTSDCGETASAVAQCGYRSACTTIWGVNSPGQNLYELRRVSLGEEREMAVFATKLAKLFMCGDEQAGDETAVAASKQESVALSRLS